MSLDRINDPFLGLVDPGTFVAGSMLWPGSGWARIEAFETTAADGRRIEEYRFFKDHQSAAFLPVAFVFETMRNSETIGYVYSDHHLVEERAGIHEPIEGLHPWQDEVDVLFSYFRALRENQLETILGFFAQDAYFQHSNGETFRGHDEIRSDFEKMMGDAGIHIQYCRVTDSGKTCVVECYMPSGRPAIAIYERTGKLLKAVRIYL